MSLEYLLMNYFKKKKIDTIFMINIQFLKKK